MRYEYPGPVVRVFGDVGRVEDEAIVLGECSDGWGWRGWIAGLWVCGSVNLYMHI